MYDNRNKEKRRIAARKYIAIRRNENRCICCGRYLEPDADKGHVKCMNCSQKIQNHRV